MRHLFVSNRDICNWCFCIHGAFFEHALRVGVQSKDKASCVVVLLGMKWTCDRVPREWEITILFLILWRRFAESLPPALQALFSRGRGCLYCLVNRGRLWVCEGLLSAPRGWGVCSHLERDLPNLPVASIVAIWVPSGKRVAGAREA